MNDRRLDPGPLTQTNRSRIRRSVLALTVTWLLSSCASKGLLGTDEAAAGDRPSNPDQAIKSHLQRTLKDPYSVQSFETGEPVRASCLVGAYGTYHGWRIKVSYNAKNSFGAYVGIRDYYYWFHGDVLRGVSKDSGFCSEAGGWKR